MVQHFHVQSSEPGCEASVSVGQRTTSAQDSSIVVQPNMAESASTDNVIRIQVLYDAVCPIQTLWLCYLYFSLHPGARERTSCAEKAGRSEKKF